MIPLLIALLYSCSGQNKESGAVNPKTSLNPTYINDSTLVFDQQYQKSVSGFIRNKTLDLLSTDTSFRNIDNQWNVARMNVVLEHCVDPTVRDFWLHVVVKDQLENYGIKNTGGMMKMFYENSSDSASVHGISKLYNDEAVGRQGHTIVPYKTTGPFSLDAHIFFPDKHNTGQRRPAIVLFHGGSWYQGKPEWMFGSCKRYASLGVVAIAIEYRLYDRHGVTPLECVSDAKSALRWVRQNAPSLGVDANKIVASGFSSGGHLVASAAMLNILNAPGEDTTISTVPDAMIFSSSCFDPTLDPWFVKQVEQRYSPKSVSPNHIVRSGLPPSLVIHGTEDTMCPFRTAVQFAEDMQKAGNRSELHQLQGAPHFYFFEKKYRDEAIKAEERYLASLGFLSGN